MIKIDRLQKIVYLGLALCIIASLAFACTAPTATPTPSATATAKPTPTLTPTATATAKPTPTPTPATTATAKPTSTPTSQYGGDLRIIDNGSPSENLGYPAYSLPRYNPFLPYPCVELLVRLDEQGLPIPWLATGWQWSSDYKSLTLNLRKGVKFHDGTDFNAAAVKYDLDLFLPPSKRPELVNVKSIDVVDDYTVRLNFNVYDGLIMTHLGTVPGSMVSPTAIKTYGADWCVTHPVGTGPFKLDAFTRDVILKYVKFADYWQPGKPYLNSITFTFIPDLVTARASFLAGEGQVITNLSSKDAAELQKTGKYNVVSCQQSVAGIASDSAHADSPFGDVRVRQAVSYAIDNKAIVDAVGYGLLKTANQIANTKDWAYNPNVVGYPYNPQKARDLLKAAGYPNGFKTKLTYATGNDELASIYLAVQRYLSDVGINVDMDPVTSPKYSQVMTGGWQSSLVSYSGFIDVGYPTLNTFILNLQKRSANYVSFLRPDDIQADVEQGTAETNQDKLSLLVRDLQSLLIDKHCIVNPININYRKGATYPTVHDMRLFDPWWVHWRPENIWLSK